MQIDHEPRVDKAITLLGSGLALVALFTLCSFAPKRCSPSPTDPTAQARQRLGNTRRRITMRYYMKTTAPLYVEAFKEIRDQASARHRFFKQIAQGWGFDEIGMQEFSYPTTFYKRCAAEEKQQRGPEIEGFKGGERHHQDGATYFKYTFRRSKHASELRKQYAGAPELPAELQGEHFRSDMATAFCHRFQLPNHVFTGNSIGFALVHLLQGDILVCNLPYRDDNSIEAATAVFPEGFEEITERAWHAEIDRHNKAVKEAQA